MRHVIFRIGSMQTRDIDQIGDDCRRGRFRTRPLAVVKGGPDRVALYQDRVHRTFHVRNQALQRHQCWMNPQLDTVRSALRNAEQLDAISELLGVRDVFLRQLRDAFGVDRIDVNRHPERDRRQNRELVCRVDTFYVECRVRFGIAEPLRLAERSVEGDPTRAHLGQDKVAGAVDDARNPLDPIGSQSFS